MSEQSQVEAAAAAKRRIVGKVVSNKADKTITVLVERSERHPVYGKMLRRSTKLRAHDENNECNEGDLVAIVQSRPLSATKHFRLVEILQRASALQQAQAGG
ncbi:MAG: 30S ribosomal protein S17 [Sinimarinibacterium flocculans]|jgi:small subunit ribosomal protein S17|uniref:Small ribosomal subunit protein uS17 n=1 Tax=Sinimarinibacterium flocculans TaxID=985250 RepID=A0A318EGN1_9GAMM|nr:30S ribosomal protein S17 [Sinimarinibacterium flocculans]PXV69866.1 SSU ribosomal protein S17P [Sinimarinibacterium flocculans]